MGLKETDQKVRTGFSGVRWGPFAGTCEQCNESSGLIKCRQLLDGWLTVASQELLRSTDFFEFPTVFYTLV
jgi:hypothetical protein